MIFKEQFDGKTLISVDIQPEYQDFFSFKLHNYIDFLNQNHNKFNNIVFLFNGPDLGMITEGEYINWLLENELEEEVVDKITFYDKGYAFFRYCIDSSIDEDDIVELVKFMIKHNINDSRDINEDMWNQFIEEAGIQNIRDLLEFANDMIYIPDLMKFLIRYNNILLVGGGKDECLKEVEIALKSLGKPYDTYDEYIYQEDVIRENVQLADKEYFSTGKISEEDKKKLLNIVGTDNQYVKILADMLYFLYDHQYIISRGNDDEFDEVYDYYKDLKTYNKNVFPIEGMDIYKTNQNNIYNIMGMLKDRRKIIDILKKLPSVALKNLKDEIRQKRDLKEFHDYLHLLEYFMGYYSMVDHFDENRKAQIIQKLFTSKNNTLDKLSSWVDDSSHLIGGGYNSKEQLEEIIEDLEGEAKIVQNNGNLMVIDVMSSNAMKRVGCNSMWCFSMPKGDAYWDQYSYNDHVYFIVDFNHENEQYVLTYPSEDGLYDITNSPVDEGQAYNLMKNMGVDINILTFGGSYEAEELINQYTKKGKKEMAENKEIRMIVRKIINELYDQPGMETWSPEELKRASLNVSKSGSVDSGKVDEYTEVKNLYKQVIDACPYFKNMEELVQKKDGYQELIFDKYSNNKGSDDGKYQDFGTTISFKLYTEDMPKLGKKKGDISVGEYFYIETVTDAMKDPNKFMNDEEDGFEDPENYSYEDEGFLEGLNAKNPETANGVESLVKNRLGTICDKIKLFDNYIKVHYDFDMF